MIPQQSTGYLCALLLFLCMSYTVSGEDACPCVTGSNCPENCTLVNIAPQARSNFTSWDNNNYTITGQAAWVTDGVTSGPCSSVSSIYPTWKAEFGQSRTVSRIKIFWEGPQKDVSVTVDGRVCHSENNSHTWTPEYTLVCDIPVTGDNLLIRRQPTGHSLNLSLCEVEIYVFTTSAAATTENDQAPSTTLDTTYTTQVTTASVTTSTENTTPVTTSSPKISKEITKPATTARATTTAITPPNIPTLITTAAATTTSPITSAGIPTPGPGTSKDDVSSIITPIMVSCVVIVVVLCVTVVIICYIRRQQGPTHQEENRNQSEKHYAGLESGHGDGDYSSINCTYEEFPNTLPDPAPPNTTDSTGH